MDKKRLTRDMANAKLGGVCAGIANYLDIDVTLVRLLWILFVLFGGSGILVYFICWIVMPEGWRKRGLSRAYFFEMKKEAMLPFSNKYFFFGLPNKRY